MSGSLSTDPTCNQLKDKRIVFKNTLIQVLKYFYYLSKFMNTTNNL